MSQNNNFQIQWTNPALEQVKKMNPSDFGMDPRTWHENAVRAHAASKVPEANRGRIRKPAHVGGTNPSEAQHITVTYKTNNRDLGAWHVYTSPGAK